MALAGRDPVFYSQLESEMAYLGTIADPHARTSLKQQITNVCLTCHGVMGKRSLAIDHPQLTFTPQMVFDATPSHWSYHYGGLARDGISCAVCHHIVETKTPAGQTPLAYFLNHKINGTYDLGAPEKLYGPFKDNVIVTHAMNEALGVEAALLALHYLVAVVRQLSHDQPAGRRRATGARRPQSAQRRASDLPRVAEQPVPKRVRRAAGREIVSGLPHAGGHHGSRACIGACTHRHQDRAYSRQQRSGDDACGVVERPERAGCARLASGATNCSGSTRS